MTARASDSIFLHMHKTAETIDIHLIKREARALRKRDGSMTYMQYLDQVARELYGLRHFHEAVARHRRQPAKSPFSPIAHYLHYQLDQQAYYMDI